VWSIPLIKLLFLLLFALTLSAETWKVWYDDGSGLRMFHSDTHTFNQIPTAPGVQIVLVCEEIRKGISYRRILKGADWYWVNRSGVAQNGVQTNVGPLITKPTGNDKRHIRSGKNLDNDVYESYRLQAMGDKLCSVP